MRSEPNSPIPMEVDGSSMDTSDDGIQVLQVAKVTNSRKRPMESDRQVPEKQAKTEASDLKGLIDGVSRLSLKTAKAIPCKPAPSTNVSGLDQNCYYASTAMLVGQNTHELVSNSETMQQDRGNIDDIQNLFLSQGIDTAREDIQSVNDLERALESRLEPGKGLMVNHAWTTADGQQGGHSVVAWQDENGKSFIIDPQSDTGLPLSDYIESKIKGHKNSSVHIIGEYTNNGFPSRETNPPRVQASTSSASGSNVTLGAQSAENQASSEKKQSEALFHNLEVLKGDAIPNTLHNLQYFEEKLASESPLSPEESRAMIDTAHYALFLPDKDEYYHSKETPAAKEIRNSGLSLLCQALDKGHRSEVISLLNGPRGNNSRFEVLVDRMYSDYRDRKESTMSAFMQDIVQLGSSGNPKLNLLGSSGKAKHGALATIYRHSPSRVSNSILLLVPTQDKKQLLQSIGSPSLMSRLLGEGADLKKKIAGDLARKLPKTTKPVSPTKPYALTQSKVDGMIEKEHKRLTAWREEKAKKENTRQVQIEALKSHGLSQSKAERVVNGISELSADAQTDALRKAVKSHVKEQEQKAALDAHIKQQEHEYSIRRKAQYAEAERQASIRIAEQEQRQAIATQTRLREIEAVQAQRSLEMVQQYEFRQAQKKALQQNTNASVQSVNHRSSVERGLSGNRLSFNQTRSIAQDATRAIGTEVGSTLSQRLTAQQLARVSSNGVANIVPQLRDTVRFSEARGYDASGKLLVEGKLPHGSFAQLSNTNHLLMEETRGVAKPGSGQVLKSGSFPGQMTVHESGVRILPPRDNGDRVQFDIVRGGVRDNAVYPAQNIHFSRDVSALSQLIGS